LIPVPFRAVQFDCPSIDERPALFFSTVVKGAIGFVCRSGTDLGILWLTGPDKGSPSNLRGADGFFVPVEIEGDLTSLIELESVPANDSVLLSGTSIAYKYASGSGAPRYATIAGPSFGEPGVFATFEHWRALVRDDGTGRHVLAQSAASQ
jgi:hypothetical protein